MGKIATKEQISLLLTQLLTNDKEINDKLEEKIAESIASITIPEPTSAKSRWYNKKWYAVGDSFTQLCAYVDYLNQYIGFSSYYNAGQNGKGMSAMTSKFTTESLANYDLVTVLCGTNDYADSRELGSISDTSSSNTFYGYTKKVIETIIQQNPEITIAFFTPTIRGAYSTNPVYPAKNSAGYGLEDYADAIIKVCNEYAVPVCDTFRTSQINTLNLSTLTSDNLHPNNLGAQILARKMWGFLETI